MNDDLSTPPIMSWNVRGLISPAKREAVREVVAAHRAAILCMQETKIDVWSPALVCDIGGATLQGCAVMPAIGTRGGIAILWNRDLVDVVTHAVGQFAITVRITISRRPTSFWLTSVYGPTDDASKEAFLAEISSAAPPASEPWIINGDFNQIYEAREKNNLNLNRRLMGASGRP
ncbi:uncharacterized protein [Aegilops tauschii subsp. strangulata]|uniref:uncharacterized protein n=1 Tax=Aegilops tauschii subsp. strangulata TaxID=200361 RepID=UPI003CC8E059